MQVDIRDKVIVITGAAQGLGRTLALGLAREGARIAVLARSSAKAAGTVDEIVASAPDAPKPMAVVADVSDENQVRAAAEAVDARWGRVDALISNAGWMPPAGTMRVLDFELADLRRILDSNLVGCFLVTKHFAPIMIRGGGGRIIYVGSMVGTQAGPGSGAYGASKAGVHLLSNVVHQELADQGIRTVALAPGLTVTPGMRVAASEDHIARVSARYPGGRVGQPEDIVPFAAFLCSPAAEHLSGTLVGIRPITG
ncbi:SDR family oxidoreductase [Amycolatopsis carbonis]|uniref:SDR family oxidoreductase n=1 Tax=Amycolatopsis carbonis TaxID=715471 RepID=A0A9Y2MVS2_9PSEU|nr:SDR family oxidoreductase [Amycolatopsis sp. 2-15]WIX83185.1 SDR family oxidoreductase [Amycolatopsis sp. 2-15]